MTTPSRLSHETASAAGETPLTTPWSESVNKPLMMLRSFAGNPAFLIFVAYNLANLGNLIFNMLFSRWMGPSLFGDLAVVLTVKLSLVSIFIAVQMAVSRMVAASGHRSNHLLARLHFYGFCILTLALPILIALAVMVDLGGHIGLANPHLLPMILIIFPIALPLCLLRGVVQGLMDVTGVMLSVGLEMAVRLIGAILVWKLGGGIEGITLVIVASVLAGWAVIAPRQQARLSIRKPGQQGQPADVRLSAFVFACLPFAVLQFSQVVLLDAEVFVAKMAFSAVDAGYLAATSLFQRIEFYACFGLASVLLPSVSAAVARGETGLRQAIPIIILFLMVTVTIFAAIWIMPDTLITLLVGEAFLPARELLPLAAASASAFTLSFLIATFMAGQGNYAGIWMIAACVPVQLGTFLLATFHIPFFHVFDLLAIKVTCQVMLLIGMALLIFKNGYKAHKKDVNRQSLKLKKGDYPHGSS